MSCLLGEWQVAAAHYVLRMCRVCAGHTRTTELNSRLLHSPAAAVVPAPHATATRPKLAKVRVVATVPTNIANMTPAHS